MPIETAIVVFIIALPFVIFSVALAWAENRTRGLGK